VRIIITLFLGEDEIIRGERERPVPDAGDIAGDLRVSPERHRAEAYVIINLREDRRRYAEAPRCLLGSLRAPLRASLARNGRDLPGSSRPPAS
jgi:hypothetical protein